MRETELALLTVFRTRTPTPWTLVQRAAPLHLCRVWLFPSDSLPLSLPAALLPCHCPQLLHVCLHDGSAPYAKYMRELTFTLENLDLLFKGP